MSFFKNDTKKKEEVKTVAVDPVKFEAKVETIVTAQVDDKDLTIANQKFLLAEAVELFGNILKGYPVSDKVKVWVESASKEL
jgi:hypothetical protein